jgi:hypothetical protein
MSLEDNFVASSL